MAITEEFLKSVSKEDEREIDIALGLEEIILRLPKDLVDKIRRLAEITEMPYKVMIRKMLLAYFKEGK